MGDGGGVDYGVYGNLEKHPGVLDLQIAPISRKLKGLDYFPICNSFHWNKWNGFQEGEGVAVDGVGGRG